MELVDEDPVTDDKDDDELVEMELRERIVLLVLFTATSCQIPLQYRFKLFRKPLVNLEKLLDKTMRSDSTVF